ncbi:MAG: hypothetical protein IJY97_08870, partial [Clostridia bacterium]|nr:hypothetical protein [Clostridia bacterium]
MSTEFFHDFIFLFKIVINLKVFVHLFQKVAELMSACAELILRFAQVNVRPKGEVKVNFLALLGNFRFLLKRLKVLIKLFSKVCGVKGQRPCRPPQRAKLL